MKPYVITYPAWLEQAITWCTREWWFLRHGTVPPPPPAPTHLDK